MLGNPMYLSILQTMEILRSFTKNCSPSSLFNIQKQRARPKKWFCCGCIVSVALAVYQPHISQCFFHVEISALVTIQSLFKESRAGQLFSLYCLSSHRFVLGRLSLMSGSVGSSSVSDVCVLHGQIR